MRVDDIVLQLRTIPAITALLPGGIFSRIQETKDQNYLTLTLVSDGRDYWFGGGWSSKTGRIEFRFIWGNAQTNTSDMIDMVDVVDSEILTNPCTPIFNYNGFKVFQVTEGTAFWPVTTTELDRPVMIKDYLFSYFAS